MANIRVTDISKNSPCKPKDILVSYQLNKIKKDEILELVSPASNQRYTLSIEDILEIKSLTPHEIPTMQYFGYIVIPVRKYTKEAENDYQKRLGEKVLREIDPQYTAKKIPRKLKLKKPNFVVGNILKEPFDALYLNGTYEIRKYDHIGITRGRDAANLIKKSIKQYISSGIQENKCLFNPKISHNAADSRILITIKDKETLRVFRLLYKANKSTTLDFR